LRENEEHFAMNPSKRSQALYSTVIVAVTILSMLICMLIEMIEKRGSAGAEHFSPSFIVFFVKFPCAISLQLKLYPEVAKGMNVMKFANNEKE